MYNTCCIMNCASRRKDVNFHMFPKSEIGLQKWLECINCDRLRSLSIQEIRKRFVCLKHFERKFIAPTQCRVRLLPDAYPTLFTANEIAKGFPQSSALIPSRAVSVNHDHDYEYVKKRKHVDHTYCMTEVVEKLPKLTGDISIAETIAAEELPIMDTEISVVPSTLRRERAVTEKPTTEMEIHCTPKKRPRVICKKNELTPHCAMLYNEYKKSRKQLNFNSRAKRALKFSKQKSFMKLTEKLNPLAKKFLWMQIKQSKKKARGRRFTNEEKLIAMAIMKQSPKCYRFLQKIFILPSKYTINKMISKLNVESGINDQIFEAVKKEVSTWDQKRKYCSILFDEVSIDTALSYDKHKDGQTLVCDQGTAFQSALKSLQKDTRREQIIAGDKIDEVIVIDEHTLSVIYDPPHLIKGLRNNFLTKDIKFDQKIAKWSDIVEVYKADCNHAQMRLLHKLNDELVIPEKIKKMKVKNCTRVFSKTVAATLSYTAQFSHHADGKEVSRTLKNTAEIVSFFDDLFDSVNGTTFNKTSKGKPLRQAVTEKSPHHNFWREAIKKIESLRYVDSLGKETSVPSLKNWVTTLKSYQRVWQQLNKNNIQYMRARYFNSDPIENFFGQLRAYNFRNNDPDCHTFKSTFRSLLITRLIKFHSETFNCEEDSGKQLLKLEDFFSGEYNHGIGSPHMSSPESSDLPHWIESEDIQISARQERLHVHSRAYTTGWVIRKIFKKITCQQCEANLINKDVNIEKTSLNNWVSYKEFNSIKVKKLTYPSEHAVRLFGIVTEEANNYLETQPQQINILKEIKNKTKYLFSFLDCELHKDIVTECFLTLTLRLTVFNWCNVINKILKGTDVVRLRNKTLPHMQLKAYNKYMSKIKNKTNFK